MHGGEFALIDALVARLPATHGSVVLGHGDDAAVLDLDGQAVFAIDAVVDGVHVDPAISGAADVGWKALAVNVSDLAAMGATPRAAVVALAVPPTVGTDELLALYDGLAAAAARYRVDVVGGDTVQAPVRSVTVAVLGQVAPGRAVRRAGARPGQAIVCVGALGAAAVGLALARAGQATEDCPLLAAHRRPQALVAAGAVLAEAGASAMIDVSDGLAADLSHLCDASGVGAVLEAAALPAAPGLAEAAGRIGGDPLAAITSGGEDYALLATLPAAAAAAVCAAAGEADGVPAAVIGEVTAASGVWLTGDGERRALSGGYDHFA